MAYTKYSLTPANNNAAPPDGAPEGMLPSAVNDTMRDMMAQIRDVGDGIRGGTYTMTAPVITGGSITGVALSGNTLTNPVISGGTITNATITGGSVSGITDLAIADGGTGASTAANARVNLGVDNYGMLKNRIINGAMVIDQRNAGASVTNATYAYTLDRWNYFSSASSKFTIQQNAGSVTPPVGFTNYLGITSTAATTVGATDIYVLTQPIEGYNVADLGFGSANAKTVTLSFWVRSSLTGTFGGSLRNSASTRSYPFSYTISAANTWEQKAITITGDTTGTWLTTNGTGMQVNFGLGMGSSYSGTAGAWVASDPLSVTGATSVVGTNGATFYITGVQLEVGTQATSFEYRQYGTELALCQRYYQLMEGFGGFYLSSTGIVGGISYKTEMRTTPTVASTAAIQITQAGVNDYVQSSANASIVASRATTRGAQIQMSNFSGLNSGVFFIQNVGTNNAALSFSAEL